MDSRGFMSIALVLLALIPIFLFTDSYLTVRSSTTSSKNSALLHEMDFYRRADIRNALISELGKAAAENRDSPNSTVTHVIDGLSANSPKISEIYGEDGIEVEFWCGLANIGELERLPQEMAAEGRAKKCASCWGFGETTPGACKRTPDPREVPRPDTARPCGFLLSANSSLLQVTGTTGTRFSDRDEFCDYPAISAAASKPAIFGASIYDSRTNTSSLVIIPQGYVVDYG
jgi:hypothetical protein